MPAAAASSNTLTYHLTSNDAYERTVPTGTIVTVRFTIENDGGNAITLKNLQDEIYYDHSFFEYVDNSFTVLKKSAGISGGMQIYTTDEHRVYVNTITEATYAAKEDIAEFRLKVTETTDGAWSVIETKAQFATDTTGEITTIHEKNLKITIGASGDATEQYTLQFVTNGGSTIPSLTADKNTTVTLSNYTTTKTNATFAGWYSDKELKNAVSTITLTGNTTVYAKWTESSGGGGGGAGGGGGGGAAGGGGGGAAVSPSNPTVPTVPGGTGTSAGGHHPSSLITDHVSYIVGRDGGQIAPQDNITRAEVATIFFRLLTEEIRSANYTKENVFVDSNPGEWYNTAISTLAKLGIINGRTANTFEPSEVITRAEFTAIAARFSDAVWNGEDLFGDIANHWARAYINAAASIGWIVGENGIFRPDDNITRAEVMTLVNRMLERQPESKADLLDGMTTWVDNADENAWYYLAVQEATNSHEYTMKADGVHEQWTRLTENPDWANLTD